MCHPFLFIAELDYIARMLQFLYKAWMCLCTLPNSAFSESARGSDSEDEVLRMKRKNAIPSDSEADSDTEVPKGNPVSFVPMSSS